MKTVTTSILAAAVLWALPFASAEACTKDAWNGNTGAATAALASGPFEPVGNPARIPRYSGRCALRTAPGQFVTDNTPNGESTYQAMLYVFTGDGVGKFFSATASNGAAGAEVVGISFNGSAFTFSGATADPIPAAPNRWYSVRIVHQAGGAFTADVRGAGTNNVVTRTGTSSAGTVASASAGFIGTGTGAFVLDEFESTRSTTPITRKCRGNAVNTDTIISLADRIAVNAEILGASTGAGVASGQPDINEDGLVSLADRLLINQIILDQQGATWCGGAN